MPVAAKQLYRASTLSELKQQCALEKLNSKSDKLGAKSVTKNLIESAKKLHNAAIEVLNKDKDEELAYIYFFRAMELWSNVMERKEFKEDSKYSSLMFGKTINDTFKSLEEITSKLEKRYSELKNGIKDDKDKSKFKFAPSIATVKKRKEAKEDYEDGTFNGIKSHTIPKLSDFTSRSEYSEPKNHSSSFEKKFIECGELKEKYIGSYNSVLVLDIRPKEDYDKSNINIGHSVNIPQSMITGGLSANKLGEFITKPQEKYYWTQRSEYKQVVLMDWFSEEQDVIPTSPLDNLLNILLRWDPATVYKQKPLILNGGFERWLDMYPICTTNPKVECPQKPASNSFIHLSEHNIEYPMNELEDIISPKHKQVPLPLEIKSPSPTPKPISIPTIDRSTKPNVPVVEVDKKPPQFNGVFSTEKPKPSPQTEPMEEDKGTIAKDDDPAAASIPGSAVKDSNPQVQNPEPLHPPSASPPRFEEKKTYPTTPKKPVDKGEGDNGIFTERLKFDAVSRSGGLKRSASSPNINKLADEELDRSSNDITPLFDRSTKPKPQFFYDSYNTPVTGTDTIYSANSKAGQGLTGLKNLGNLCYMNSIMQCISNTVELTRELTRFNVEQVSNQRQIVREVSALLRTLWQGSTRVTNCRNLKSRVGALRQSFSTMEQQDSHEFLTILMDWLHEDLNEPSVIKSLDGASEPTGEKAWGEFCMKNKSVVLDLFYGQLKSTVTCNHCQKQSVLFEPFSNLSVPLPPQDSILDKDRKCSIQDCLKLYLKGETISGWVCPSCKVPREATKKLDITKLPPVLIIHLKRFMTEMVGMGWCRKRMNMVEFPISDLNMKPYAHPDSELRFHNYNLYAVSNHYGSMDSGHYTAYCKNYLLNKWYKFDDHDVNEMSPSDVKSSAAYILFYESSQLEKNRILD